jgi:membrane fusion protein (multidrug efflux system)
MLIFNATSHFQKANHSRNISALQKQPHHNGFLMTRPMSKMLTYVGIFFLIVFGWYGVKKAIFMWFMAHFHPPAATVSAEKVMGKTWQPYLTSVGSLTAVNGVDLAAEASGIVKEIHFNSGQYVHAGDTLLVLDTALQAAELKDNQAKLKLAQINFERAKILFEKHAASQAAYDESYSQLQEAEASVEAAQAKIKQKTITAPFSGRIGIRQANLGQFIAAGTSLVTLQSLSPLYVMFSLPEQHLPDLYLNQSVEVTIQFGKGKTVTGKITAINSKVDQTTRNVLVQATIPNDHYVLYPGMFALVKVALKPEPNKVIVPQTAVSYSLSGDYVFVVKNEGSKKKPELHAYRQYVKAGEHRGDEVIIQEGLKPGDEIVTSGQLKIQNGAAILIDKKVEL